jgi:hypothetical protein
MKGSERMTSVYDVSIMSQDVQANSEGSSTALLVVSIVFLLVFVGCFALLIYKEDLHKQREMLEKAKPTPGTKPEVKEVKMNKS